MLVDHGLIVVNDNLIMFVDGLVFVSFQPWIRARDACAKTGADVSCARAPQEASTMTCSSWKLTTTSPWPVISIPSPRGCTTWREKPCCLAEARRASDVSGDKFKGERLIMVELWPVDERLYWISYKFYKFIDKKLNDVSKQFSNSGSSLAQYSTTELP